MIPSSNTTLHQDMIEIIPPFKTYGLNLLEGKITPYIDGIEAIQQAVFKILETKRFHHEIYDFSYGAEIHELIGRNVEYMEMELRRRIRDALTTDDRIEEVTGFTFQHEGEQVTIAFRVMSIYGNFESEVRISV